MAPNLRTNFLYDPERQGYDTDLWKTLAGSPSAQIFVFADTDSSDLDIDIAFDEITIADAVTATAIFGGEPAAQSEAISITEDVSLSVT